MMVGNPIAMAAGKPGAPKIADKVVSGSGTTTVWGLKDFGGFFVRGSASLVNPSSSVSASFEIQYSTNLGGSYSSPEVIVPASAGSGVSGGILLLNVELFVDFSSAKFQGYWSTVSGGATLEDTNSGTLNGTIPGLSEDVTHIRLSGLSNLLINPQGGETAS